MRQSWLSLSSSGPCLPEGRTSAIDTYLAELSGGLFGSARRIRDITSEARSGLEDLVDDYESRGISRREAERLAVDEFGAVEVLGRAFQEVLAIEESRRTALITTLVIAIQPLVWGHPYDLVTHRGTTQPGPLHGGLSITVAAAGIASATFMLWALAASHADVAASRQHPALARWIGRAGMAATIVIGMLGVALGAVSIATTDTPAGLRIVWAMAFLFAPLAFMARAAKRALDATPALRSHPA